MPFAYCYTSGSSYDNVNGKCMVPSGSGISPMRRFAPDKAMKCGSGSCMGGSESSATLYIQPQVGINWTGVSGVILCIYATNTTGTPGSMGGGKYLHQESRLAIVGWDISSQNWYSIGEFCFSRGASGASATGKYPYDFNEKRYDVGSQTSWYPLVDCDHNYMWLDLDLDNYIWGVWGGHAGSDDNYGFCGIQCFRSTLPINDPLWNPSGDSMWINKGEIHPYTTSTYQQILTGRCSCHYNWYWVVLREAGGTAGRWIAYYSPDQGTTWHSGIRFLKKYGDYSYGWPTLIYDSKADKTLLFVRSYPDWTDYLSNGYGIYWTDCHRMSGSFYDTPYPDNFYPPTGGFFSTAIDPINVTNTNVVANGCPCQYSGTLMIPPWPDRGDLEVFDRYDPTRFGCQVCLDPDSRKIYFTATYDSGSSTDTKIQLAWKTLGTTNNFVSSTVITGIKTYNHSLPRLVFVSGNNHDKYMLYQTSYTSIGIDTVLCYYLISSPVWSSATNWTAGFCKIVPDDYEYTRPCKYVVVSPNKRIITTSHDQGQTYESVEGSTLAESFLTFWDNNIDYFAVKVSGVNYVDGTSAEIIGKVLNHSGNVTLFYDTSDKGEDVSAWSFSKDCGLQYDNTDPGLSNGYFTVSVDGLTPNTEYVFRFYMSSLSTWV